MKKTTRLQIGVIGSMLDIKRNNRIITIAKNLGKEIANKGGILLFGFENDSNSLSMIAAKSAEKNKGKTIAFIQKRQKTNHHNFNSAHIVTGQERGGGREFSFILSCDAVISLAGGSGTLMEIAMAYQAGIPVIVIENSSGWSEKLQNTFLDERKRNKIISAKDAKDAVLKAIQMMNSHNHTYN